jgi:hypothetical protein
VGTVSIYKCFYQIAHEKMIVTIFGDETVSARQRTAGSAAHDKAAYQLMSPRRRPLEKPGHHKAQGGAQCCPGSAFETGLVCKSPDTEALDVVPIEPFVGAYPMEINKTAGRRYVCATVLSKRILWTKVSFRHGLSRATTIHYQWSFP